MAHLAVSTYAPVPPPLPTLVRKSFLRPLILLLLRAQPRHGYELVKELQTVGLTRDRAPVVYRLLEELLGQGLVRASWEPGEKGPARRIYHLTPKGTRQLRRDGEALVTINKQLNAFARDYREVLEELEHRKAPQRRRRKPERSADTGPPEPSA